MEQYLIVVLLVLGYLSGPHQVTGQDVEIRTNDKEGGSQARTIYSQRHLSPHRMMHFGKRLPRSLAPSIQVPVGSGFGQRTADLDTPAQAQPLKANAYVSSYPHLLTIELDNGQVLQELPQDPIDLRTQEQQSTGLNFYELDRPGLSLKSQLDRLVALNLRDQNQQLQQEYRAFEVKRGLQQQQQEMEKSSRLISAEPSEPANNNAATGKSSPGELAEQPRPEAKSYDEPVAELAQSVFQQQQQLQQQLQHQLQQQSRNTRSSARVPVVTLSDEYLRSHFPIDSRRLYAHKKAEPKSVFMHFGRK